MEHRLSEPREDKIRAIFLFLGEMTAAPVTVNGAETVKAVKEAFPDATDAEIEAAFQSAASVMQAEVSAEVGRKVNRAMRRAEKKK